MSASPCWFPERDIWVPPIQVMPPARRGAEQIRATAILNRPPVLALKRVPRGSDHTAQALTFFFGAGRAMMHLEQSRLQLLGGFF